MTESVAIVGAGAFGRALAHVLAQKGQVTLWGRGLPASTDARLPGHALPESVHVSDDLTSITARTVLLAMPAQQIGEFVARNRAVLDGRRLVSCAKGIDLQRLEGPAELIAAACPGAVVAVLTGAKLCRRYCARPANRPDARLRR